MSIEPARLVNSTQRSRVAKFRSCLPHEVEQPLGAREAMRVANTNATLLKWQRRAEWEAQA